MRLSDCFVEIFAYTELVVSNGGHAPQTYEQVRGNMLRLIAQSEECFQNGHFDSEDFNRARFAVFAWVDEKILTSEWEGRNQWQKEQLQRIYFNLANAGELFFQRLSDIGPHQRDVREVYYLCLVLGFTGRYGDEADRPMLEQLTRKNLMALLGSSVSVSPLDRETLFPEAYAREQSLPQVPKGRWPAYVLVCAGAPVALYGFLFLVYSFVLSNIGGALIGTVQ